MKISRKYLRKLIKEESKKLLHESYMKQRYTEMGDEIISVISRQPGISGMDLVSAVSAQYPENPNEMPVDKEEVFAILDDMMEDSEVWGDFENDGWYIPNTPEAIAAMDAQDQFSSREANPHDGGMYGEERY